MWVDPADTEPAWGAAAVRNSGDKIVSVDSIQLRGTEIPVSNWYYDADQSRVTVTNFQAQLIHTGYTGTNGMINDSDPDADCGASPTSDLEIDLDGTGGQSALCLDQASAAILLNPGERAIVYFKVTDGLLSSIDAGTATAVSMYAGSTGSPESVTVSTP